MMESSSEPVHEWFCLTYANYLVLPRSVLQSMPLAWQRRFVAVLEELDGAVNAAGIRCPEYRVHAVKNGKFISDPIPHYDRGRTVIDLTPGVAIRAGGAS